MVEVLRERLRVEMIAPSRAQCGVSTYTDSLIAELARLAEVSRRAPAEPPIEADIAHIQHEYFLFGGVAPWKCRVPALLRRIRQPVVMTVHELLEPAGPPHVRAALRWTNRLHFGSPRIRRLIVHTERDRARLLSKGIAAGRIAVIRHGVPESPALPSRDEARRMLNVEGRFVLTLFGFLSRKKGHLLALEALRGLPEDVLLVFAGGRHPEDRTEYVRSVEARAGDPALEGRARITGFLAAEEVGAVMAASDLALAPFVETSGSGSMALAFACGLPIVASDIAPHREIVADSPGALHLFRSGDAADLARAIRALKDRPDELRQLAAGAREYARSHTYRRMAEETLRVYEAALADTPKDRSRSSS